MRDVRHTIGAMLDKAMRKGSHPFDVADWQASAVIIAPHPDDETLGCGGVVSKKLNSGADVRFIFVTDGSASHSNRVDMEALRITREGEAIEAVCRFGGSADRVRFLRVPDGMAKHHVGKIADAVAQLLFAWQPQSVFVTHVKEPPADHVATNLGVRGALQLYGRRVTVFEYPVWYWCQWPWVRLHDDALGLNRTALRQMVRTLCRPARRQDVQLQCLCRRRDRCKTSRAGSPPVADGAAGGTRRLACPGGHRWRRFSEVVAEGPRDVHAI
ncbi:GlcNAc-PI de-N-acetylase [Mesorhizobium tianshanense]|uniref:GlcNAc-PI de-N-acetylase n=1 Tax=Mesorhizobium tianshanense TaxID=39844 RepID=A0A562MRS5_9HYPH|nr:GlcNAc-PI de-N-acetylase [Mesorhizobium tianshanense]